MALIALIDGPLVPGQGGCVARLDPGDAPVEDSPAGHHARVVAATIRDGAPDCEMLSIPVFRDKLSASVVDLVTALGLAAESGAAIVHCSLGLARDDPRVARAIEALSGRIVVASAPARGGPVWPAALPSVFSVQGDARCGPGEWSVLGLPGATYGACPRSGGSGDSAGASLAAAHMTGILAGHGALAADTARALLQRGAAFHGRERRLQTGG